MLCAYYSGRSTLQHSSVDLFNTLGWVPYYVESDIKRCLIAYKRVSGAYPDYISELLELNSSQHSRNTRGANLNIFPRRYNRAKEGGRRFSVTNSKCWNHLPLKIRSSSSVNILKSALYKQIKLTKEVVHLSTISSQRNFLLKIARSKNVKKQEQLKLNVRGSTLWSLGGLLHLCPM